MPFDQLTREGQLIRRRRMLIAGNLGVGKTTALVQTLRTVRKQQPDATMVLLSFPGEKGYDSIPVDEPGLVARIWSDETGKIQSHKVVKEVEDELVRCLVEKPTILAGDGFHKFFNYIIDTASDGAYFDGADFPSQLYGRAYSIAGEFLSKMMHSKIPLVFLTTWTRPRSERSGRPDESAEQKRLIPQKIYPDLPPQLARTIVGDFSVAVIQTLRSAPVQDPHRLYYPGLLVKEPQKEKIRVWQTRPYGEIEGVVLHGPVDVTQRIPTFIPASYAALDGIWAHAEAAAQETK